MSSRNGRHRRQSKIKENSALTFLFVLNLHYRCRYSASSTISIVSFKSVVINAQKISTVN